jgi:hypothetical protein
MGAWFRRLAYLLRRSRHEAELREEIEAHRSLRADRLERDGLTPQDATDASRRAIGNVLLAREDARDVWLGSWAAWWRDVRHGVRTFSRNPAFTAAAVVTIALGIGVNTGIFSVLNAVTLRDLPAANADQLVSIHQTVEGRAVATRSRSEGENTFSTSEYRTYRDRARTLAGIMGYSPPAIVTLGGEALREITGTFVTCDYFEVLQQPLALGPGFSARHCEPGAAPAIVLGHDVWSTAFGADPGIIGREVLLNRQPLTVVGVAPERVHGVDMVLASYFAPIATQPLVQPGFDLYSEDAATWLTLIGRKSDETSLEQVRAELAAVAAQIDRERPPRQTRLTVARARYNSEPGDRQETLAVGAVLMTAFGLVLLLACANVANLLLARATGYSREIAVRFALGASRARIVQQLLTESTLISFAGGLLGSVVAMWSVQGLVAFALSTLPPELPALTIDARPDLRVLLFALVASLATGVAFGLAPALQASRQDLHSTMKQDAPSAGGHRSNTRLQSVLLGVQVSVCMVLMIVAGLLLRGLQATQTVEPGFNYADAVSVSFDLTGAGYDAERAIAFHRQLMERSGSLPGVDAVAQALITPLSPRTHADLSWDARTRSIRAHPDQRRLAGILLPGRHSNRSRTRVHERRPCRRIDGRDRHRGDGAPLLAGPGPDRSDDCLGSRRSALQFRGRRRRKGRTASRHRRDPVELSVPARRAGVATGASTAREGPDRAGNVGKRHPQRRGRPRSRAPRARRTPRSKPRSVACDGASRQHPVDVPRGARDGAGRRGNLRRGVVLRRAPSSRDWHSPRARRRRPRRPRPHPAANDAARCRRRRHWHRRGRCRLTRTLESVVRRQSHRSHRCGRSMPLGDGRGAGRRRAGGATGHATRPARGVAARVAADPTTCD